MTTLPQAIWSRAGLMVRLQPLAPGLRWWGHSMTLDDARALVRSLQTAIEIGQQHLNELKEQKAS